MGANHSQLDSCTGPSKSSWRRWRRALKKSTARLARRLSRMLLDDAPTKRYAGTTK